VNIARLVNVKIVNVIRVMLKKIKQPKIRPLKIENKVELNCLGYPTNDPYGLSAAFWRIFTKPEQNKKNIDKTVI